MTPTRRRALTAAVALAVMIAVVSGCGGAAEPDNPANPTTTTTMSSPDGTSPSTSAPVTSTAASAETAPATTVADTSPAWDLPFPEISLLTEETGVGLRPELAWQAVTGTDLYMVTVRTPQGEPYWSWMGAATSIHLGGEPQLVDDAAGPALIEGMSWSVLAFDTDGNVIGMSAPKPISP